MRHHDNRRKLGRKANLRKSLLRSLALALIRDGKIKTTEAKAKELRPYVEKLVTRAKNDSLQSRRLISSKLGQDAGKLFSEIAPRYKERPGGYTRIVKTGVRSSDGARMAIIEFI